jgi:signal transduction histidine kinase
MSRVSTLAGWAPRLTQATGILLILLGIIHLIATPFLIGWSSRQLRSDHASLVIAAMRLNHILVGILLLPLGVSTFWSGKAIEQSWALRLATMNAIILLCLPILLVTTMPLESLDAPLFRLAILVLIAACLVQLLALAGVWRSRQKESSSIPARRP